MEKPKRTLFTVAFTIGAAGLMSLLTMVNACIFFNWKSYVLAILNMIVSLINWQVMFEQIRLYIRTKRANAALD